MDGSVPKDLDFSLPIVLFVLVTGLYCLSGQSPVNHGGFYFSEDYPLYKKEYI